MFDIDKLGLSTLNYKRNGSTEFEVGSEKYYQNQLIKDYLTLLTDPHTLHILHRSIDNDTKLLKDVLAEIEKDSSQEEQPYGFYSLSTLTERKDDYITGKIGIGPFALNNNNHILTMLYGVKFKDFDDSIMSELGLTDLSISNDKDGNSIMSWLSALINAHVDIAKDPYISRLNVNPFTYNLINTLIRTGLGKKTFYFTTQPIMKELARAYNNAGSSYMADQYKSQYQLLKDAIEKVAKDRFGEEKLGNWTFDEIVQGLSNPKDNKYKPIINHYIKLLFDGNALRNNANKSYEETHGTTVRVYDSQDNMQLSANQVQMLMYFAYLLMNPYALSVSNLVKYSKIDTKKHGKSYIEQQTFLKGFNDLFYNRESGGLFEEDGLTRLAEDSYIALKTFNAIATTKNILKGLFLQSTNAFDNAVQVILNMIGKSDSKNIDLHKKISLAITASIKSEFINQYSKDIRPDNPTFIRDLVSESEENLEYTQSANSNRIKVVGTPKYDLKTYIGKDVYVTFDHGDRTWNFKYTITGYDESTGELITNGSRKVDNSGRLHITGGQNTIYDRFLRLAIELRDDPTYKDVLDAAGEPRNMLLRSLVTGKTFSYSAPMFKTARQEDTQDTYPTLKFIKLFNALDQNGVESNYIIDAWDELLHDTKHSKLKEFAEDLVVYAFVTSGDQGGFTKFFKQVPYSWRKESGYGDFIARKLVEFQTQNISFEQLSDAVLNNWFDNQLVPKYELKDENKKPLFMAYYGESQAGNYANERSYPTILGALKNINGTLEPSIDPDNAPLYIKIPRRNDKEARDSQRRVTVYKRISLGMKQDSSGNWVSYPIYVKIEPKGNQLKGNFLMTEYGREDSTHKEYAVNQEGLKKMYQLGDFISRNTVQEYSTRWGQTFSQLIEDMNYRDLFVNKYSGNISEFESDVNKSIQESSEQSQSQSSTPLQITPTQVTKIISGALTGVDTIGLEVGRKLGLETGGTITPGFVREKGVDSYTRLQLEEFGVKEIPAEIQAGRSGREFYLPRTEQNVINSDGTVYFASDEDSAGKIATERFAKQHNKPFLLNPTAEELRKWCNDNNIRTLNVAGNRGSKIGNMRLHVIDVLTQALGQEQVVQKTVEDGSHIATRGYRKGDPQKHPEFNYVFTENAQAYIASAPQSNRTVDADLFDKIGVPTTPDKVKLNVSDMNGNNQAGIRTDASGNITPNAYGVVVKKYQQNESGRFVAQEGTFKDTDEDFELFKKLNEDVFSRLESSSNKVVIFPSLMALGRSALPLKFAEWLKDQLANRFNVISEVVSHSLNKNESEQFKSFAKGIRELVILGRMKEYEGYGLLIKEVGVDYDWQYIEDSGYTGLLEELGLPEKVRMNGKLTYRPRYDFGRIYLTDNERQHVTEHIEGTYNDIEFDDRILNSTDDILQDTSFIDSLDLLLEDPGNEIKSGRYVKDTSTVEKAKHAVGYDFAEFYSEDGEWVLKSGIKIAKFILDHNKEFQILNELFENSSGVGHDLLNDWFNGNRPKISVKDAIYDAIKDIADEENELLTKDGNNYIEYSYTDSRQLELFSDEDFALSEEEKKEVEEIKKQCKGDK